VVLAVYDPKVITYEKLPASSGEPRPDGDVPANDSGTQTGAIPPAEAQKKAAEASREA
jgi:hypothetical protein